MILRSTYIRFYRSFNFDYLGKRRRDPEKAEAWDKLDDDTFYPYVEVGIDPELTCVVGANESGKSQLLTGIECALGVLIPTTADFCRYSTYFTVAEAMKLPHFGLWFTDLDENESAAVAELVKPGASISIKSFRMFRTKPGSVTLYLDDGTVHEVGAVDSLEALLPTVFRINPKIAIPNSVPISFVAGGGRIAGADPGPARRDRWSLVDPVVDNSPTLFPQLGQADALGAAIAGLFKGATAPSGLSDRERKEYLDQLDLAFHLLVTVGGIHVSAFTELQGALRNEDEGLANGIVSSMNEQLATSLNLTRWWSQDQQFTLAIAVRDYDVVFTVRDRTGSEYSFAERSGGLKYFLSYLVQFLAHISARSGPELLLMDEPDAYLSNQGQQDLLKVFQEFTLPHGEGLTGQVVFVTHSPFLIDKNRADRIRVLDKGSGEEGARVVRDVGHNHFEPLRTALGGFVGETTFIGNCNLMLEGMTDQVYLAGMSGLLKRAGAGSTECLDLNQLTLVPAGSASHVPYMTYLARGRDADQPAVIVLLDGDKEGDAAVKALKRGGPRNKQLIRPEYVTQLKRGAVVGVESDRPEGPFDIEDLIPAEIGLEAARRYLEEMEIEIPASFPKVGAISDALSGSVGILDAIQSSFTTAEIDLHLEKLGFARHVLAVLADESLGEPAVRMRARFAALFSHLTALQRTAERERSRESIASRVDREKTLFVRDHSGTPSKADVVVLLERIEAVVDQSVEGDALVIQLRRIREDFELHKDLGDEVPRFDELKDRLETLKYAEVLASQPEAAAERRSTVS